MSNEKYHYEAGAVHNDHHKEINIGSVSEKALGDILRHFLKDDAEDTAFEEVRDNEPANAAPGMGFAAAVIDSSKTETITSLLRRLMTGKQKPKDVMMPVRAAMEAGVIRRPTWDEFCSEFGIDMLKSKASFSDYTNPGRTPYEGEDFEAIKAQFLRL